MMLAISRNKDPKASAPYLSLLKLSRPPFSDHAGEAFFHADPQRAQHLDMLQHLAQYSDEVLLVSGERGSGKTELLDRFLDRAEEHWRTCRIEGGERLEADTLFARIAACFQLDLSGSDNLLEVMQKQLSALQEQQLPLLLIDDAQSLSDDALEIVMHLAVLEGEHGKLIRVLLFAEPSLEERLGGERFAAMPQPHKQELPGLEDAQIAAYLDHRLHAAGYQGEPLFSSRDLKQLQRQSGGLPGPLNDAAHELLKEKLNRKRPAAGNMRRYLQMGVAASAVIGTVVGLNDKINALLGGEPQVMTVSAPERPVVRLADEGNPWAVVIRNGESIQINCGAPGGTTVGVRPLMTASLDTGEEGPLTQPIMKDVSPTEPPMAEEARKTEVPAEEAMPAEKAPPAEAPMPAAKEAEAPVASATAEQPDIADESTVVAANDKVESPLVVKQEEKQAEENPQAPEKKPAEPPELKLDAVEPSPVPTGDQPTTIMLKGSGFQPGSKVAVSHAGRVRVLPQQQVRYVDGNNFSITITPGKQASDWAAQISTPDKRRSNVLRFSVEPKPESEAKVEEKPAAAKPEPESVKTPAAESPVVKKPSAEKKAESKPTEKRQGKPEPAAKPRPMVASGTVMGYDWYADQPKSNYTLQLLASEKRANAEAYAKQHKLQAPVGEFAMAHNGKTLYALTQGSYPNRAAAEKAAKALPAGVKPWVRSMASVQQVMKREKPATKTAPATASAADGERYKDTAWVWSQDPNHYTVQLSAASSEQAIQADMRRISLPGEMTVVKTLRDGKPWYALIYGSFASKAAARGTIDRLPAQLKQAGPWPRSFASLQDELTRSTPAQ